jgi:hypothetical protein
VVAVKELHKPALCVSIFDRQLQKDRSTLYKRQGGVGHISTNLVLNIKYIRFLNFNSVAKITWVS